jgi:two-component system response regulator GlrR
MNTAGRILLVDDEPSLLKMMSVYLRRLGFEVATAASPDEAMAVVRQAPAGFGVAVVDATMSGMSMRDLVAGIVSANPSLKIIAASGYPVEMSDIFAVAPGRAIFLQKPFSPEMLAAAVRRMLAS